MEKQVRCRQSSGAAKRKAITIQWAMNKAYLGRVSKQRIVATASMEYIPEKMLLAVVSGENGDFFGGVTKSSHVHESCHDKLRLGEVLIEVGIGL